MRFLAAGLLLSSFVTSGCGGGGAGQRPANETAPARPPVESQSEPTTVAEANARIERARATLESALPSASPSASPEGKPPASPEGKPPSHAPTSASGASESPCASACRAFASMKSAVEVLCRLTGDADAQCKRAKKVLDDNVERMKVCVCD